MLIAVNALGITQITAWGTSYYCLGVLAKPIVAETGWAMTHGLPGLHRRALGDGLHLDLGRPAHRPDRRPRGDVDRHDHRVGRAPGAFPSAGPGELSRGLGRDRRRHALLSLRRGVRRLGSGGSDARPQGHLLSDALRRLCLDRVLGGRPLPERGLWLARHAHDLRGDQSRRLPAAQLDRSVAARGNGGCDGRRSGRSLA